MNAEFDDDTIETLEQRAAYWLVLLGSSDCTPENRYAFEAWKREDPAHEIAFLKIQRGNAFIDRHITDPVLRQLGKEALEQSRPNLFSRHRWTKLSALAAMLLMVFGLGTVFMLQSGTPSSSHIRQVEAYETEIGERSTVTLSDGSVVTLNTNSRIEVDYTALRRDVKLLRGQGFFEVSKDVDRPFTVEAGDKRVVALGTAFDVRFDDNQLVEVTLLEGRVSVDDVVQSVPVASVSGAVSAPAQSQARSVELLPGERLVAMADAAPEVIETNADEATSWRKGRLIFRNEPISKVIKEMNRYSVQQLKLGDDARVQGMLVSGVFSTGRASSFVDALERMHPLSVLRSGENELTLVWQE